jgi:hypothetical protein
MRESAARRWQDLRFSKFSGYKNRGRLTNWNISKIWLILNFEVLGDKCHSQVEIGQSGSF